MLSDISLPGKFQHMEYFKISLLSINTDGYFAWLSLNKEETKMLPTNRHGTKDHTITYNT